MVRDPLQILLLGGLILAFTTHLVAIVEPWSPAWVPAFQLTALAGYALLELTYALGVKARPEPIVVRVQRQHSLRNPRARARQSR